MLTETCDDQFFNFFPGHKSWDLVGTGCIIL